MKIRTILAVATAALLMTSCGGSDEAHKVTHSVMLVNPDMTMGAQTKNFSGVVEEAREISVGFKTAGQIARVFVKEGDHVRQGQVIAKLDDKDYKLGVEAAQIQYDQLSREVARLKKLHDARSISGNDYDKAASGLEQVRVNLQTYKNKLTYTTLTAPTSGYVQKVNFEAAEMVNAGTPIITLLDVKQMEVVCSIPASLYINKENMESFTCTGRCLEGKTLPLKLISITPKADGNQLYSMRLSLPSEVARERISGQNVEVSIQMKNASEATDQCSVPAAAVFNQEGKDYVWTYNAADSCVHRTAIETAGFDDEGRIIVKSGLNGTEQVVKAGAGALVEGEKVRVVTSTISNIGDLI